jgi:hypothetical protein
VNSLPHDDDPDEEMYGNTPAAAARRRERARCAAIFAVDAGAQNLRLAACLAFSTPLKRDVAISVLNASAPAATGDALQLQSTSPQSSAMSRAAERWNRAVVPGQDEQKQEL